MNTNITNKGFNIMFDIGKYVILTSHHLLLVSPQRFSVNHIFADQKNLLDTNSQQKIFLQTCYVPNFFFVKKTSHKLYPPATMETYKW